MTGSPERSGRTRSSRRPIRRGSKRFGLRLSYPNEPADSLVPDEGDEEIHISEEILEDPLTEESGEGTADDADATEQPDEVPAEPATPAEEVEKWKDHAARAQAELENYRKRMAREKGEAILYANRSLLEQLLPVIDNFEMGLRSKYKLSQYIISKIQILLLFTC